MGRRSFGISATQINRMISAARSAEKERQRQRLINSQAGISTKQPPTYDLIGFDFNQESRVCHVEFLETTKYRKISKYVTSGGVRHPIYSDWNTKTKTIKKTLKLTNDVLENLKHCGDALIMGFSYEIVSRVNCEDLYPSWFIIETLQNEMNGDINDCEQSYSQPLNKELSDKKIEKDVINRVNNDLSINHSNAILLNNRLQKLVRKKDAASNKKFLIPLTIVTLGIYLIFHSKKRIDKLANMIETVTNEIEKNVNEKKSMEKRLYECESSIKKIDSNIKAIEEKRANEIEMIKKGYFEKINAVEPLPLNLVEYDDDSGFVSLSKFSGMTYEKIIGCYVIRNTENGKCYVGQSKDVFKRVTRDHFSGTKVRNIIFAEDYYKSSLEDKNNLFEVKVIKCETKDELDKTEKELIELYDSFNNGYNGTSGNN